MKGPQIRKIALSINDLVKITTFCLLLMLPLAACAGPQTVAGAYHIELTTETGSIPTNGPAKLLLTVTDAAGKPVEGVTIHSFTKMPGMNMGEREEGASPVPGKPGVYLAKASFAMEGAYEDSLRIDGPFGTANAKIELTTGESAVASAASSAAKSSADSSSFLLPIGAVLLLLVLVAFMLRRMKAAGQPTSLRGVFNRTALISLLMVGLTWMGAIYAIDHFRRPGAWTPIEAQGMEMNLPAPVGTAPVELATVEVGYMESTVRYSGQAVGYVEQDVSSRVTGDITWMPFYPGDHLKPGEVVARLDTSQSAPQVMSHKGSVTMALEGVEVARKDYQQALAMITEAHAEVGIKTGAVDSAEAEVDAAVKEQATAQANQDAADSMLADASAALQAAQADQQYWRDEITREATLLKSGAVTREEYQRELAQSQNADAKVHQAQAHITQSEAQIRGAQSEVQRSIALIASAKAILAQTHSELEAHHSHVKAAQATADAARQKITQAQAGVTQARGMLAAASATLGYSEIHSETEGVVTERIISPGVLIHPGQTILRIAQISPIRLQANVTERDLEQLRVGDRALVRSRNWRGIAIEAHITSIAPSVDPASRTGIVEAVIPNRDARFLPGQFVSMDLSKGQASHALHIPTRALRYHTIPSGDALSMTSTPTVWIADPAPGPNNQFTVREVAVKTGISDTNSTEIFSGLRAGEHVVTEGQDYLKDGDTVSVPPARHAAGGASEQQSASMPAMSGTKPPSTPTMYTCPMHPEIVRNAPGRCPKCGIVLVVKDPGASK